MTTTEIVASIDQRLTQAETEIAQLERARAALLDGSPAIAPTSRRRPRKTAAKKQRRRAYTVVPAGKLTALLDGSDGMSTPELAKAADGKPDQVLSLLRELEQAEQIRRTGQRRGTRWHLITDEDRVAARAAELAARSTRRAKKAA